jgi:hypothetical protein
MHVNVDVGLTRRSLQTSQPTWTGLVYTAGRWMARAERLCGNASSQHRTEPSEQTAARSEMGEVSQLMPQERMSAQASSDS